MITLDGKIAIITGAAHGQGAAEARLFASLGARVVAADIDVAALGPMAESLGSQGLAVPHDVSDQRSWEELAVACQRHFGVPDILVNNAGTYRPLSLTDADMAEVRRMVDINQIGCYLGHRIIGAAMRTRGSGAIVNVASVAALAPGERSSIYGMTKAAVVNLTKGAALELAPSVRVNCILPGGVATQMLSPGSEAFFDSIPLRRVAQPEEMARAVAFFASDFSSYCTGATLVVDGGWTLGTSSENFRRLSVKKSVPE